MKKQIAIEAIAALLIVLFLYAATSKLITFQRFYGEMNSQPFPNWMTPYLVWIIPSAEILIAIGLMIDRTRLTALYASFALVSLFTIYIGLIMLNVFDGIPCSCGGVLKQLGWKDHLLLNLFFVGVSMAGIFLFNLKSRIDKKPIQLSST